MSVNQVNTKHESHVDKTPLLKKRWQGRCVCGLDVMTWGLGSLLIITGIVLFTLQALYGYSFVTGASVAVGLGMGCLLFGLITHCGFRSKDCCAQTDNKAPPSQNQSHKTKPSIPDPLPLEKDTRAFFEEKGIFGLPQELIDELDIWRKYRTHPNPSEWQLRMEAGFILHGEPGTGKTTIAKCIAELLGGEYFEKKSGDMDSKWAGETEQNITELFTVPEDTFRVITIDEIEGLVPTRKQWAWKNGIVSHILGKIEGTAQTHPKFILVGTTNDLNACDPAVTRRGRLGIPIEICKPDEKTRQQIFAFNLSKISYLDKGENWTNFAGILAQHTMNLSCAAIVGIIGDAERKHLLEQREIQQQDFVAAVRKARQSA